MSHAALTQRYRPQTFAELAGQPTIKAILSRAAAEDKVAPGYIFSGTRGVGKTTVARIFAKALNCKQAPTAEPCNQCDNCRAITAGSFVDVIEIDGASNNSVNDVRSLRENVGYAPMNGRYKIFIIDEAHMLSTSAFNALLKTLEEPPAHVTFIMATTEPNKFPATILSRSQHYVFKSLSSAELEAHLTKILKLENCPFEESALALIVRRAAGSVRDAMSLLGQVLALGGKGLTEADTRMVLGLAGQEIFFRLMGCLKNADCPGLSALVRELLDQGLDLGFFLRELSSTWRNLFLLRQAGEAARGVVDLPPAELERWLKEAEGLDITYIHAAWQMTLEGQRRVLKDSMEPALALELLLLNLAMLPRLLSMEQISSLNRKAGVAEAEKKSPLTRTAPAPEPASEPEPEAGADGPDPQEPSGPSETALPDPRHLGAPDDATLPDPNAVLTDAVLTDAVPTNTVFADAVPPDAPKEAEPAAPAGKPGDWPAFVRFCAGMGKTMPDLPTHLGPLLSKLDALWADGSLTLTPPDVFSHQSLHTSGILAQLNNLLVRFCGTGAAIKVLDPPDRALDRKKLGEQIEAMPAIKAFKEKLGARFVDYGPWRR